MKTTDTRTPVAISATAKKSFAAILDTGDAAAKNAQRLMEKVENGRIGALLDRSVQLTVSTGQGKAGQNYLVVRGNQESGDGVAALFTVRDDIASKPAVLIFDFVRLANSRPGLRRR